MAKIRGKKMTVEQMKALQRSDETINIKDYLFYGEESVDANGYKCTSKNSPKQKYWKYIHRTTGDIVKVAV